MKKVVQSVIGGGPDALKQSSIVIRAVDFERGGGRHAHAPPHGPTHETLHPS